MSLREEFIKKKCKKCNDYGYYCCIQPTKEVRCFINWLEKRDEEREKLLSKERQAKEELLKGIELSKEIIKRYVAFNILLMDEEDKENVKRFDDKLEQLINKHTEKDKEIGDNGKESN